MNQTVLHKRIREQGGAYGGSCGHNFTDGIFTFNSYRDPNITSTFAAFEEGIETILAGDFTDTELFDGILEVLQDFDAPIAPGSRAEVAYFWLRCGKDQQMRQEFRDRLLSIKSKEQLQEIAGRYLKKPRSSAVFAGESMLKNAASK